MSVSVAELSENVAGIAAVDRSGWSGAARSAELVELLAVQERLAALVIQVTGAWDRDQSWALDGAVSPPAHAQIAARAAKHREQHYPDHETVILDAAKNLDPARFRDVMRPWALCADTIDDPKPENPSSGDADRNYLDIAKTFENVGHLESRFDALAIKTLIDVLDQMEPPDPRDRPGGPRTLAQTPRRRPDPPHHRRHPTPSDPRHRGRRTHLRSAHAHRPHPDRL